MSIEVHQIKKSFGSQEALKGISFSIPKGEIVGFLGPNGAGKSTMMRILTTYYRADEGSGMVCGLDLASEGAEVRKRIGYLPEHNPLYTEQYVKEYLHFVRQLCGAPKERVAELIERTGLVDEAHKRIGQLSKGYRQRVGLAAALMNDPEVLLLDEPTTGLDPNQLISIRALIRELGKERTILFSTHIMKEVEAVCDRVMIINKGELVADNPLKDLQAAEEQVIEVEFDYRVEEVLLQQLPDVSKVTNVEGFCYEITFRTQEDRRPAVFDFAHDNDLKTLNLNRKTASLEELFNSLTH
jgi:ABC-2 type transport system ATP-binding protein